jgi:hypothetical protein
MSRFSKALIVGVASAIITLGTMGSGAAPGPSLVIQADTVLGPRNLKQDEMAAKSCVSWSRFARNEQIVWRVRVFEPATGKPMDDKLLEAVSVLLPDGTILKARYGGHPGRGEPTDFFWTTSWVVPATYPTGTLRYKITARTFDARLGEFMPFNVAPSLVTIVDAVRPATGP